MASTWLKNPNTQFQIRYYAIKPVTNEPLKSSKAKQSPEIVLGEVSDTSIRSRTTRDNVSSSQSANNRSLDIARVAEADYILYEKRNPKFTQYATYIAAGSQLLCWFLFAELVYRYMEEAVERDENGEVKSKKSAPLAVRLVGSSLLMCVGILLALGAHSYAKNTVKTLTLLQGGKDVAIETCNLVGRPKRVVPASNVALRDRVFTGYGEYFAFRYSSRSGYAFENSVTNRNILKYLGPYGTDYPSVVQGNKAQLKAKFIALLTQDDRGKPKQYLLSRQEKFTNPAVMDFLFFGRGLTGYQPTSGANATKKLDSGASVPRLFQGSKRGGAL
jgi:hypothetical protein